MDVSKQKLELVESFGIHFEQMYNLPPLGSKILGLLILDGCSSGLTFEEFVSRFKASKSSVSTNLNLLLKLGKITFYTIEGDRKKYFKPAPFSERLAKYNSILLSERKIIDKLMQYRQQTAACENEFINLENIKAYRDHVTEVEILLKKTIDRFKEIENITTKHLQ